MYLYLKRSSCYTFSFSLDHKLKPCYELTMKRSYLTLFSTRFVQKQRKDFKLLKFGRFLTASNGYTGGLSITELCCLFKGIPAVITLTALEPEMTLDDVPFPEACRKLEEAGADVVGINCSRGPRTILPVIKEVRAACKVSSSRSYNWYFQIWPAHACMLFL